MYNIHGLATDETKTRMDCLLGPSKRGWIPNHCSDAPSWSNLKTKSNSTVKILSNLCEIAFFLERIHNRFSKLSIGRRILTYL